MKHFSTLQKPDRYCTFCRKIIKGGKLRRHMERRHKYEMKEIPTEQRLKNAHFEQLRKDGIHDFKMLEMAKTMYQK